MLSSGDFNSLLSLRVAQLLGLLIAADSSFLLANARIMNYPIVYCNDAFCKLSGFNRAELVKQSSICDFMKGPLTDADTVKGFADAFEQQDNAAEQIEILFYKKSSKLSTLVTCWVRNRRGEGVRRVVV